MLLEKAYVIDGIKLQETIMYDIKMMSYHYATYENAKSKLDEECSFRWYKEHEMALRRDLYWQGLTDDEIEMIVNYMRYLQDSIVHGAYKMY